MPLEVISMDADALYPSITARRAREVVEEQVTKTRVEIQNVDYKMAARYIAKGATPGQVFAWGLSHLCPRRAYTAGRRPDMSGAAEVDPKWVGGREPVGREEEMKVVGRVLSIATDTIY